jgi:hypothetical protein
MQQSVATNAAIISASNVNRCNERSNNIGEDGVRSIAAALGCAGLRTLDLSANNFGQVTVGTGSCTRLPS